MGDREGDGGCVGREAIAGRDTAGAVQLVTCHSEFKERSAGYGVVEGAGA
jgi:hypothetical protein